MRRLVTALARLVGTTFEDWLLAAVMVAVLALTVGGVRSCAHDQFADTASEARDSR